MKTVSIKYTRNDRAKLEWFEWAHGYPIKNALAEISNLRTRNKDFDFKIVNEGVVESE